MTIWIENTNPSRGNFTYPHGGRFSVDAPAPVIMAGGMNGDSLGHWYIVADSVPTGALPMTDKPPYRIPSMSEIMAIPQNGFTHISTFSGCGGSSLGFHLAGYHTLWASEFVPAAYDTYAANFPETPLDSRDIRDVTPADILSATSLAVGELDVLEGSPPCASFSTAGRRHEHWGEVRPYSDVKQRTDDLFFEFIRLLDGLQPRIFVAENVSGLVRGVAKGYFKEIHRAMQQAGYIVEARLLDAKWLGVPQSRLRTIFVGVRADLSQRPAFPDPLPYWYSIRDAIPWMQAAEDVSVIHHTSGTWSQGDVTDTVSPAIMVGINSIDSYHYQVVTRTASKFMPYRQRDDLPMRTIMAGDARAEIQNITEREALLPPSRQGGHAFNYHDIDPVMPSATVTVASPGNDLGVPGPNGRRKLTIAELRRLCAFPDDFILTGTYAQQWERLGRAVPPLMMAAVAHSILPILRS